MILVSGNQEKVGFYKDIKAIQWTLMYEYAHSLTSTPSSTFFPHFQCFKFAFAMDLADLGLLDDAAHHFEALNRLLKDGKDSSVYMNHVFNMIQEYADKLCIKK